MHFAFPLPWWAVGLVAIVVAALVVIEYRRPFVPLTRMQRGTLAALRGVVLAAIVAFICRPIVLLPPASARDAVVPILVDVSRSMRLADADGQTRIARAASIVRQQLVPQLARDFRPEVLSVGDAVAPASVDRLGADARQTDLAGALAAVRERYRGQQVAGIVLLSDGGETEHTAAKLESLASGPAVFAIGVGTPEGLRDREVVGVTAGDPRLDQAAVDLHVAAISSGFGRAPFQLRVLENGREVDSRRIVPPADGSPIEEVFTVSPNPTNPTVYTAAIPAGEGEAVVENNARSILVSPAGRKRKLLVIEGSPGFEHSFITRAFARDPGLEVDSIVRKGKNADGQSTYFVQAGADRTQALLTGFPGRREDLYAYDALVIANVEGDYFTRAQLAMAADFVADRGGGLLVFGNRSFAERGLLGTPIEEALPVELDDRRGGLARASFGTLAGGTRNKLVLTPDGEDHPIMRLGATREDTRKAWAALPPLASAAPLGGPRAGATVLAVTQTAGGGIFPIVAVQRYGQGRSMIFAGEASWRWKMMMPATDRSHEFFWRQAARWLAAPSPDPVAITVAGAPEPGDAVSIDVDARDNVFAPVADAAIDATLTPPGGDPRPLTLRRGDGASGRYSASVRVDQAGLYRVHASAARGSTALGTADRWFYVGGADREFADPRLNEGFLRRVARASGGRYVRAADAGRVVSWLRGVEPQNAAPERRDLWHEPWALGLVILLLSSEWILRRRWGLR